MFNVENIVYLKAEMNHLKALFILMNFLECDYILHFIYIIMWQDSIQ